MRPGSDVFLPRLPPLYGIPILAEVQDLSMYTYLALFLAMAFFGSKMDEAFLNGALAIYGANYQIRE